MVKSKLSEKKRLILLAGEMAALGALAVIFLVFVASTLDAYLIRQGQGAAVISSAIFDLTNTDRKLNNLQELTLDPTLTAVAQAKANDMAAKGYFAHTSPEGKSPWYWFKEVGYQFSYAGENLAIDFSDSADVERAWMNSPTHRANILNDHFTQIGVALAVGNYNGHQTTYVVQEFGTPAKATLPTTLTPTAINNPSSPTEIALATTEPEPRVAAATDEPKRTSLPETTTSETSAQEATLTPSTGNEDVLGSAAVGLSAPQEANFSSLWNDFAASPRTTLRYAYYLFGIIILIALLIETGLEIRKHHLSHVALVVFLLAVMVLLFFLADSFIFTKPLITENASLAGLSL